MISSRLKGKSKKEWRYWRSFASSTTSSSTLCSSLFSMISWRSNSLSINLSLTRIMFNFQIVWSSHQSCPRTCKWKWSNPSRYWTRSSSSLRMERMQKTILMWSTGSQRTVRICRLNYPRRSSRSLSDQGMNCLTIKWEDQFLLLCRTQNPNRDQLKHQSLTGSNNSLSTKGVSSGGTVRTAKPKWRDCRKTKRKLPISVSNLALPSILSMREEVVRRSDRALEKLPNLGIMN